MQHEVDRADASRADRLERIERIERIERTFCGARCFVVGRFDDVLLRRGLLEVFELLR